ncbi:hypothetical protein LTR96_010935 [Exophiala xenobiotica]|nr:hypothetical protein LTR92_010950 [Exophiala xenobiotica]KAK5202715.1 hypothetical protein LTR41_011548 [Exophiala xenobiotica]KAK5215485.1 hypothetical protein LTR72_011458 [Exophiala xenobiotica]KAK5220908.1 hypothetical protein LTR47_011018 [Exophiala xenobiotica]KAK5245484.1 hypothetical protein LTS06_009108 [Exophiala xenobiotica]
MDSFVLRVQNIAIGGKYHLERKLGSGSFGNVYLGRDAETGNEVAMKLEHHSVAPSLLEEEARIYQSLARKAGFPRVYWHGQQDDFMVLVFELLGPNLEDLFRYCGDQFSLKTTLMLADQLLHRFESLHSHNYLHQDVKPENFLQGMGEAGNIIYMTDLGLAIYRHPDRWISNSPSSRDVTAGPPQLLGNMQICKHQRAFRPADRPAAQSRRDDLEALGYMLVYFIRGRFPWQGFKAKRDAKHLLVLEKKQATSASELCAGLPTEFEEYMDYVPNLRYEDRPDYRHLRKMFNKLFRRQGFEYGNVFDWTIPEFLRLEPNTQEPLASNGCTRAARSRHHEAIR